eukprot:13433-Heterococcus_DN1.PRE.2
MATRASAAAAAAAAASDGKPEKAVPSGKANGKPEKAGSSSAKAIPIADDDYTSMAQKHHMQATSISETAQGALQLDLTMGGKHKWTLIKSSKSYTALTDCDFLQDNLFCENLEEALSMATSVDSALKAAAEVYTCIAGPPDKSDNDNDDDDNSDYEYEGAWVCMICCN